jgi:hypothetical protein
LLLGDSLALSNLQESDSNRAFFCCQNHDSKVSSSSADAA